jgi:thiol:disulfide interchange protein
MRWRHGRRARRTTLDRTLDQRERSMRTSRRLGILGLLALLACGAGQLACTGSSGAHGQTAFSTIPFEDARAAAASMNKLFLVDATATWCGPCKTMEADTWPDAEVRAWMQAHTVAVQVDVDKQAEVAQQLGIRAMPTIIVFRGETELARREGGQTPQNLLDWLKPLAQ